jgi:hypothetical protein
MTYPLLELSELCTRNIDLIDPKRQPDHQFSYIDISAVDNQSKRITTPQRVFGKDASVRARQVIQKNDVLIATTRPNLNSVALVPESLAGQVCSTGFCVLRTNPLLDPEYLFAYVQSPMFVQALTDLVQGALYPAVTDKQVRAQKSRCHQSKNSSGLQRRWRRNWRRWKRQGRDWKHSSLLWLTLLMPPFQRVYGMVMPDQRCLAQCWKK